MLAFLCAPSAAESQAPTRSGTSPPRLLPCGALFLVLKIQKRTKPGPYPRAPYILTKGFESTHTLGQMMIHILGIREGKEAGRGSWAGGELRCCKRAGRKGLAENVTSIRDLKQQRTSAQRLGGRSTPETERQQGQQGGPGGANEGQHGLRGGARGSGAPADPIQSSKYLKEKSQNFTHF